MRPVLRVLLCWLILATSRGLEISHQALEDPNGKLCGPSGWCDENTNSTDDLRTRNCMCDDECDKYGDCCLNSRYFNAAQQRRAASSFACTAVDQDDEYVYTKVDCPPHWRDTDTRRKCERSAGAYAPDDPLLMTPVTSNRTNVTYGNIFCAVCNRDSDANSIVYWNVNLDCRNGDQKLTDRAEDYIEKRLSFNADLNYWQVQLEDDGGGDGDDDQRRHYKCDLVLSTSESLKRRVRRCRPTVKTCPATWGKDEIRQRCESYTSMVHRNLSATSADSYRNVHCAICNSVPVQSVGCQPAKQPKDIDFRIESFSILFDFNGGSRVGQMVNCTGDRRVYDRFFRRCRNVVPARGTDDDADDADADERDRTLRRESLNCSKVIFDRTEFEPMNDGSGSVYLPKYGKTVEPGKYVYVDYYDTTLEICKEYYTVAVAATSKDREQETNSATYRPYYSVITFVGIGVSVVCLCAHLIVFAFVKELRNLSGKNLASFCAALLAAYCSFALGDLLDGRLCFVNAICTYYLFLAAFTWMLIMSFDVWRTLRIATKELRVSSGQQWRKFFVYSFCSWVLPAKIALIAVLVDLCPTGFIAERFRPRFGARACWFGQGPPILVFFGAPVFAILVCNVVFFASSAYMIYSSHSMTRYSASPATKRDFRLYARLAVLMGLTWIFGLLAAFADNELLWVVFIASNTSLGVFVFVAFTCRRKVLRALKNLKRDSVLNLPAFSWSMNPSEMDAKSHVHSSSSLASANASTSEKPTSNTYY